MADKKFNMNFLKDMSIDELSDLNKTVVAMIKSKRSLAGIMKKSELEVGQTVYLNSPKFRGEKFVVEKINIKKALLKRTVDNTVYNVPLSMIEF